MTSRQQKRYIKRVTARQSREKKLTEIIRRAFALHKAFCEKEFGVEDGRIQWPTPVRQAEAVYREMLQVLTDDLVKQEVRKAKGYNPPPDPDVRPDKPTPAPPAKSQEVKKNAKE